MRNSHLPPSCLAAVLAISFAPLTQAADVAVDRATKYQTIEGFGFFGAMDSWWGTPANLVSDAWAAQALGDLGITMWRNEYYPPADSMASQDADWAKQRPVVLALKRLADANQIPLRVLLTVWSPPSTMKCRVDSNNYLPIEGTAPQSTKNGNTLCQEAWDDFASWLIAGLQLYRDAGVDVYGLSFQNEPYFYQPYNSCFYVQPYYAKTLAALAPRIKAAFPSVKLFGPENMLEMEAGSSRDYFYISEIKKAGAQGALDALAVHGYNDGVVPTATTRMATLWSTMSTYFAQPLAKPLWMTETSGYLDTWMASAGSDGKTLPGASDLAYSMYAALYFGHVSAWVWWQGSEARGPSAYTLMAGTKTLSKRYYVSKQFFRFIRPGAVMVKTTSADSAVLALAFEHSAMGSFTAILINASDQPKTINLTGAPTSLAMYTTTASDNCADAGTVSASAIALAPDSISTLVSGSVYESGSPIFVGAGGSVGGGGAIGSGGATGSGGRTGSGSGGAGGATGRRDGSAGGSTSTGGAPGNGGGSGTPGSGGAVGAGGRSDAARAGSGGTEGAADGAAANPTGGSAGLGGAQGSGGAPGGEVDGGVAGGGGAIDADLTPVAAPDGAEDASLGAPEHDAAIPLAISVKGSGCGCALGSANRSSGTGVLLLTLALAMLLRAVDGYPRSRAGAARSCRDTPRPAK